MHYAYVCAYSLMQLAIERLVVIFALSVFTECDIGTSFSEILIVSLNSCILCASMDILQDLSMYQNEELLHESLHLLGRIYSAEENLFEKATQTQVS